MNAVLLLKTARQSIDYIIMNNPNPLSTMQWPLFYTADNLHVCNRLLTVQVLGCVIEGLQLRFYVYNVGTCRPVTITSSNSIF